MSGSVTEILRLQYQVDATPGQKVECPECGHHTFSVKSDDSLATCFHPGCEFRLRASIPQKSTATVQPLRGGLTLENYASAKSLDADVLRSLSVTDCVYGNRHAVRIPYFDAKQQVVAVRYRVRMEKGQKDGRFLWERGTKLTLYGVWLSSDARVSGHVVLVEGESDAQTLWCHTIPALGIPGAGSWKEEWAKHLDGIGKIYVVIEPDAGGEAIKAWLAKSAIRDRVWLVRLDGAKDVSELHCQDPAKFEERWQRAIDAAVPFNELEHRRTEERLKSLYAECDALAREPDILGRFGEAVEKAGLTGESSIAKIVYLALTSRLLNSPTSVAIKGPSSAGKSFTAQKVLDFFPENAYYALSAMSDRSLAYGDEPLAHRFLVLYEAAGMNGDMASYLMRSLLSEGRIRYETVEKGKDGRMESRLVEREGPTGLLVTTTSLALHPENETRLLSLTVSDSPRQTREVLLAIATEDKPEVNLRQWVALQEWLGEGETRVSVPFGTHLAELIRPFAVRLRRDFTVLLTLIRAHALLHRDNRARDSQGRIMANGDDYHAVRELASEFIAEGVEAAVPQTVRECVGAVAELLGDRPDRPEVTKSEVAQRLGLDKSAAWRRVKNALKRGFLTNLEERSGRPARIVLGEPLPEDNSLLPSVEQLMSGCMVAG